MGPVLGLDEGPIVGVRVDGTLVGNNDGETVGDGLGTVEGVSVGETVGEIVGDVEGIDDGFTVG